MTLRSLPYKHPLYQAKRNSALVLAPPRHLARRQGRACARKDAAVATPIFSLMLPDFDRQSFVFSGNWRCTSSKVGLASAGVPRSRCLS